MNNREILEEGSRLLGLNLTEEQISKLLIYKDLLVEWNKIINLTAIKEEDDILIKHFLDSISCVKGEYIKNGDKVIDVGTGAGFPGIPLHIYYPDIRLTLLDSLQKRIKFLQEVYRHIKVQNIQFEHGRAEDFGLNIKFREKYDVALARAVAELNILCEYCLPFVKVGGFFVCQKGPGVEEELNNAKKAMEVLGGKFIERIDIKLPFRDFSHNIIIIKKIKQTPTKYPRKAGTPTKNPIL